MSEKSRMAKKNYSLSKELEVLRPMVADLSWKLSLTENALTVSDEARIKLVERERELRDSLIVSVQRIRDQLQFLPIIIGDKAIDNRRIIAAELRELEALATKQQEHSDE